MSRLHSRRSWRQAWPSQQGEDDRGFVLIGWTGTRTTAVESSAASCAGRVLGQYFLGRSGSGERSPIGLRTGSETGWNAWSTSSKASHASPPVTRTVPFTTSGCLPLPPSPRGCDRAGRVEFPLDTPYSACLRGAHPGAVSHRRLDVHVHAEAVGRIVCLLSAPQSEGRGQLVRRCVRDLTVELEDLPRLSKGISEPPGQDRPNRMETVLQGSSHPKSWDQPHAVPRTGLGALQHSPSETGHQP